MFRSEFGGMWTDCVDMDEELERRRLNLSNDEDELLFEGDSQGKV